MHYAEGSFMPPLVLKMVFSTILEKSPFFVRPFTSIVTNQICNSFIDPANFNNFRLVDSYLMKNGGRKYLAGGKEPTGGDFMVSA
jgi:glutathione S-transferase